MEHRGRASRRCPGVYVGGAKIAALGIRVRRGCTFHGLSLNVDMDLEPFHRINPCGYQGLQVTSVLDLGGPPGWTPSRRCCLSNWRASSASCCSPLPHCPTFRFRPERPYRHDPAYRPFHPLQVVSGDTAAPAPLQTGVKQIGGDKIHRSPVQFVDAPVLRKPSWIRVRIPSGNAVQNLKAKLRENRLVTVCEEASCPNIHECFSHGTATFMILGEVCTRRCSFCDVAHGRPKPPDANEPASLAITVADMGLKYVVVTSVDRDDLRDGGAQHFVDCISAIRTSSPNTRIEILTPDFRGKGRMDRALDILALSPPDVFNHNIETVPDLYRTCAPARITSGR